MTQEQIEQQALDAIIQGRLKALQSKETARQFLIDAGIIREKKKRKSSSKRN